MPITHLACNYQGSTLNPITLLKCSTFLVTSEYPLVIAIPEISASLKSIGIPLRDSSDRISANFLELSKVSSRTLIELNRSSAFFYIFCSVP